MSDLETNLHSVEKLLAPLKAETLPHFTNGKRVPGRTAETFEGYTPIDNSVIGSVASGSADDIDVACNAAETAFEQWREMPGAQRKKLLHKIADAIVDNAESIALVESYDSGQPLRFMSKAAVRGAENFRFFADMAPNARDLRPPVVSTYCSVRLPSLWVRGPGICGTSGALATRPGEKCGLE